MTKFRIYYDGQPPYDGPPYESPGLGVLVIVQEDRDHGRRLITQGDYYIWRDERWWAVDFIGMIDYLLQPGPRKVIVGRKVDNEDYYAAVRSAERDPDFPTRTAWAMGEEKVA